MLNNAKHLLCFDLYILRDKTGRKKILNEMVDDISRIYSAVRYILTFWRRNFFLILAHPVYKM